MREGKFLYSLKKDGENKQRYATNRTDKGGKIAQLTILIQLKSNFKLLNMDLTKILVLFQMLRN